MDDSAGPEEPEIYDRNFTVISEDMKSIGDALYGGLNQTRISEVSVQVLLGQSPSIGYDMELTYADGSWVCIAAFQTSPGCIIFNHGKGAPDRNLINGTVLEPLSALDSLVSAIYAIFLDHLE